MNTPAIHEIIVFTRNNARIVYVLNAEPWMTVAQAFVDADRSAVKGIAPHYWKQPADGLKIGGKILPMNDAEKAARDQDHAANGVENSWDAPAADAPAADAPAADAPVPNPKRHPWLAIAAMIAAAAVAHDAFYGFALSHAIQSAVTHALKGRK